MFKIEWKKLRAYALVTVLAVSGTVALMPAKPVVAQGRSLPDFTDLVEQVGPSVVNIRTVERARNTGAAPGPADEEMQEFFRRFFGQPMPGVPRQSPRPNRPQQPEEAAAARRRLRFHTDDGWLRDDQRPRGGRRR